MTVVDQPAVADEPSSGPSESLGSRRPLRADLVTLIGLSMALVGVGIGARRISDNSFLTHLATGREMVESGFVRTDRFTWTSVGEPIVIQSWLASLVYGAVDAVAGLWGIRLLMAATAGLLAYLAWRLTARSSSVVTRVVIMAPVLLVGLRTWSERPLLLGLVLVALVMMLDGRRPALHFVIGAVWVNVHGSWPLGLVLIAARWAGGRIDRSSDRNESELRALLGLAVGCVVGGVVNPYGPRLLFFPLELLGRSETLSLVAEWKSPTFDLGWTRAFLVLLLLAVGAVSRRSTWRFTLPMLLFVAAALVSRRNIPVAVLVMLPVLAQGLPGLGRLDGSRTSPAIRMATGVAAALVLLLPLIGTSGPHFDGGRYPEAAVDAMEEAGLSPELVNTVHPDFVGNYLGLRYRGPTAWIDDRFELHPRELVADYVVLLEAEPAWREVLARHDAEVVIWPSDAPLTELVRDIDGWPVVFADEDWSVLCRPDVTGC